MMKLSAQLRPWGVNPWIKSTLALLLLFAACGVVHAASVPGCNASGYFQVVKVRNRWMLADGQCQAFFAQGVYDADFTELRQQGKAKYNGNWKNWATHSLQRMQAAGFNSLDIYYSDYIVPVGTWGGQQGASIKLPFFLYWSTLLSIKSHPEYYDPSHRIANICDELGTHGYHGYCSSLMDVFDPLYVTANRIDIQLKEREFTNGFANEPQIIGVVMGDIDTTWAIRGNGSGVNGDPEYPQPAQIIATSNPSLYSKQAWVSYLQQRYAGSGPSGSKPGPNSVRSQGGSIDRLNAAWGSDYTDWNGVLNEDGSGRWFGSDYYNQTGMTNGLKQDLDAFLEKYVARIYAPQVAAIRSVDRNHILIGGSALGGGGDAGVRPAVLRGMLDAGVQLAEMGWDPTYPQTALDSNRAVYDSTGLPEFIWYGLTSQADSPYDGGGTPAFHANYATQQQRGTQYATDMQTMFNAQASNGDYYVIGVSMWALTDKDGGENSNWGLVSINDNLYDGRCAVQNASTDQWGWQCGGETGNYGDFFTAVKAANQQTQDSLNAWLQ